MESSECAQQNPLTDLKQCIESEDIVRKRDDISLLFSMAAKTYPNKACNLFMRAIEKLLKAKAPPISEIRLLFAFLTANENQVAVEHVLTTRLPRKYSQIDYYLRVYALRALGTNRSFMVSRETLLKIAGDRDTGKLAVIDFILTRSKPLEEDIHLLRAIKDSMNEQEALGRTRCSAIEKIYSAVCVHTQSTSCGLDWEKIDTLKSVIAHWDQLKLSSFDQLRQWIESLLMKSNSFCDSRIRSLSKALVNLGAELKHRAISAELFSAAIELEAKLDAPSSEIFNKTWRLCLLMTLHPEANREGIILGLKLCCIHLNVQPGARKLSEEEIQRFSGVTSAILQTKNWLHYIPSLKSNLEQKLPHAKVTAWLFLTLATMDSHPDHQFMTKIMVLAQNTDSVFRMELEKVYCCALGTCFDEEWLLQISTSTATEPDLRNVSLSLLARSTLHQNPYAAYQYCTKLTRIDRMAREVILEGGFVDLASQFSIDIRSIYPEIPIQTILTSIEKAKPHEDPTKMVDRLVGCSFSLFHSGCHHDALRFVQLAIKGARHGLGAQGVRLRAMLFLREELLSIIGENPSNSDDHTYHNANYPSESPEQQLIDSIARLLIEPWLKRVRTPECLSLQINATQLVKTLHDDILWSTLLDSVMADPPIVQVKCNKSQEKLDSLAVLIKKSKELTLGASEMSWVTCKHLMREIRLIRLIENQLPVSRESTHTGQTLFPFDVSQHRMLEANRSFHISQSLPTATKWNFKDFSCVCLEIDEKGALLVTRIEGNKSVGSLRLPLGRRGRSGHNNERSDTKINETSQEQHGDASQGAQAFENLSKDLDRLVDQSMKIPTHNAKDFWAAQEKLDSEMQDLISQQEKAWLGGFVGIICGSTDELSCDHLLTKQAQNLFAAHLEFPRPNIRWEINPLYIALLRIAYNRGIPSEIEDVVMTIIESMNFQGLAIDLQELNLSRLMQNLRTLLLETDRPASMPYEAERRLVLICDKSATQVPWEMFPIIRENKFSVTRALSLEQVAEWSEAANCTDLQPATEANRASNSFLVNPGCDLPLTHKTFIEDFRRRGWKGTFSRKPSEEELRSAIVDSNSFVYVGHGSGKGYIRGSELRRHYRRQTAVFLFGCNSLRVKNPLMDDDALTDYSVMGSSVIVGTLWTVKDKDINRFSSEFLSRIFDCKQSLGTALRESREACVLSYLTGGAPVAYGLP